MYRSRFCRETEPTAGGRYVDEQAEQEVSCGNRGPRSHTICVWGWRPGRRWHRSVRLARSGNRDFDIQGPEKADAPTQAGGVNPPFLRCRPGRALGGWAALAHPGEGRALPSLLETSPPTPQKCSCSRLPECPSPRSGREAELTTALWSPGTKVFVTSFFSPECGFRHSPSCSFLPC